MARLVRFELRNGRPIWINPELVTAVYPTPSWESDFAAVESASMETTATVKGSVGDVACRLNEGEDVPVQGTDELSPERLAEFKAWLAGVWRNIAGEAPEKPSKRDLPAREANLKIVRAACAGCIYHVDCCTEGKCNGKIHF